ncbi:hypothetical protein BDQ17DRAFT_1380381 [Cyathus striatus]|nr:hypothetical protein BDQ17DRAFT_1380381 [Cyathus striatus]
MCRLRQVVEIYALCGHRYALIRCEDRFCKFSVTHPGNCGPDCRKTCWQYRQFPEQYDRTIQRLCPNCQQDQAPRT